MLHAFADGERTSFPCVDCGLNTGNFCDGLEDSYDCFACDRVPKDFSVKTKQATPLCTYCETLLGCCRFCRGVHGCTPPESHYHWSGTPQSLSRNFDDVKAQAARKAEWKKRARRPYEGVQAEELRSGEQAA